MMVSIKAGEANSYVLWIFLTSSIFDKKIWFWKFKIELIYFIINDELEVESASPFMISFFRA